MSTQSKLPQFIKQFLMIDVYENMSNEDKEFMGAMMLAAKVINALTNPLKFVWIAFELITKRNLAI